MNEVPCSCEGFLLGTELADPVPSLEHGPCGGSSFGDLGLKNPSASFNGRDSSVKYTYNLNPSLHDNMTIDGMLLIIICKVVSEMEEGGLEQMLGTAVAAPSQDFSEDLWKTV
ncbi:hypothetical protein PVL29_006005 [Vitis rotundifolia]|uniref:Uncharacterized protein n=1 Tax=Vitis rotundifolia TaxID=103349 RepID=A0AA39DYV4_VITRO|nr:hypothetical protein PVL29_006005 [Vitis rotundifolia]